MQFKIAASGQFWGARNKFKSVRALQNEWVGGGGACLVIPINVCARL